MTRNESPFFRGRRLASNALEPVLIGMALLCVYLAGNASTGLWDRDEPRYAGTALNMLETGDYTVPYFNGTFRFTKPVLTYWLAAASMRVLGVNEFAARLPSGLAVATAAILIFWMGNQRFGAPAGRLAALLFGLSPIVVFLAKLCIPDGVQLLFGVIGLACLWRLCDFADANASPDRESASWAFGFWLAMAFAMLTKGPIVPGMALASLALHKCLTGNAWRRYPMRWRMGMFVSLGVAGPWYGAIYALTGSEFFREAGGRQLIDRVTTSFDKGFWPPGYYAVSLAIGIFPWLGFFWVATRQNWRSVLRDRQWTFLCSWTFGSMAVLEAFRSKQPHYYAPAYPAILLFVAAHLAKVLRKEVSWNEDRWSPRLLTIGAGISGVGMFGIIAGAAYFAGSLDWRWLCAATVAGLLALAGHIMLLRNRWSIGICVQLAAPAVACICLGMSVLPSLSAQCVAPKAAEALLAQHQLGHPILLHRVIEPSLTYYSGLPMRAEYERSLFLHWIIASRHGTVTLLTENELRESRSIVDADWEVLQSWSGFVKMHRDIVHLVRVRPLDSETIADAQRHTPTTR